MLKYSIGQMLTSSKLEWAALAATVAAWSLLLGGITSEVAGW